MMQKRISLVVLLLLALIVAGCSGGADAAPGPAAAERAADWLVATHQNDDGGFTGFSAGANQAPSDVVGTIDALPALAAGGDAVPALDYLRGNGPALQAMAAEDGGQAGKIVLAMRAAGVDPANFEGHDYTAALVAHLGPDGAFAGDSYKHALAMLGMAAVGQEIPATAIDWLESNQSAGGSWDDGFGTLDNADATGMAIMALLAAGRSADDAAVAAAVDFLTTSQAAEGGWSYGAGLPVSANSTAVVIQALIALGIDPTATDGSWAKTGRSPLDALLAWQGESGAFQADFGDGPFDDFYSTVQAIPAAAGRALPPEG